MFHGFGQDSSIFQTLSEAFTEHDFTVYSIDLFYHGNSVPNKNDFFITEERIVELIIAFKKQHQIEVFSVLGFSIGAKYALTIANNIDVDNLILLAPDGLLNQMKYKIITSRYGLRGVFRYIVKNPKLLYGILKMLKGLGLLSPSLYKFSRLQMGTVEERRMVYNTWVSLSKLKFNKSILKGKKCYVFAGKYDKVISVKKLQKVLSVNENSEMFIVNYGHSQVIYGVSKYLTEKSKLLDFLQ